MAAKSESLLTLRRLPRDSTSGRAVSRKKEPAVRVIQRGAYHSELSWFTRLYDRYMTCIYIYIVGRVYNPTTSGGTTL